MLWLLCVSRSTSHSHAVIIIQGTTTRVAQLLRQQSSKAAAMSAYQVQVAHHHVVNLLWWHIWFVHCLVLVRSGRPLCHTELPQPIEHHLKKRRICIQEDVPITVTGSSILWPAAPECAARAAAVDNIKQGIWISANKHGSGRALVPQGALRQPSHINQEC